MDREKVIERIHEAIDMGVCVDLFMDVLELLKKQEAQKFFVDESGKITPLPVVVRCKDCTVTDENKFPPDGEWVPYALPWVEGRCIPEKKLVLKDGKWSIWSRYPVPDEDEKKGP